MDEDINEETTDLEEINCKIEQLRFWLDQNCWKRGMSPNQKLIWRDHARRLATWMAKADSITKPQ